MADTTTDEPRIWIGCYACYNAGNLVGEWIDADADAVEEHIAAHRAEYDDPIDGLHEEYGAFDYENTGSTGECIQTHLDAVEALEEWEWLRDVVPFPVIAAANGDGHSPEDFRGEFETPTDLAYNYVDDTGMLDNVPDCVAGYFDYEAFGRDLAYDFATYRHDGTDYYFLEV